MAECVVPVISYVPLKHPESDSFIKFSVEDCTYQLKLLNHQ